MSQPPEIGDILYQPFQEPIQEVSRSAIALASKDKSKDTFVVERGLAAQRTALLLEEGPEHHHASETLAPLVPAP